MPFHLSTLGCKVNQYETEFVRTALLMHGYAEADEGEIADLVIVNTCTVTAESEAKSRKIIRKLVRENPGANVVVMGCVATHKPNEMHQIGGVAQVITDKERVPDFLRQLISESKKLTTPTPPSEGCRDSGGVISPITLPTGIASFGDRHRAFVKVQDGCNAGCAYCIIPKVRPTLRSRPIEEILPEIQTLARNGYREIVLTGIHLGHYGVDFAPHFSHRLPFVSHEGMKDTKVSSCLCEKKNTEQQIQDVDTRTCLTDLIRQAVDLPEEFRIRLSSLEAVEVTDELLDLMQRYPDRLCPHLHLPMQSGNDEVLRLMKRRWLSEPFVQRCEEILSMFDRLALTTDVIVGFPGETAEHFDETCRVVERLRFSKVHLFRFSPREGTEAATLPNRVPPSEQKRRARILTSLANNLRSEFAASLVGSTATVLLETPTSGTCGRYLDVQLDQPAEAGTLVFVRIERREGEVCFA